MYFSHMPQSRETLQPITAALSDHDHVINLWGPELAPTDEAYFINRYYLSILVSAIKELKFGTQPYLL